MRHTEAFVSVGSNILPEVHVPAALHELMLHETVTGISTMYRTEPIGRPEQAPFVNGVWRIRTKRDPRALKFEVLRSIERNLGRIRTADKYAPRTIDLDIALYGDSVIADDDLEIPDPDILRRPFLAVPLIELDPAIRLPRTGLELALQPVCSHTEGMTPLHNLTQQLKEIANL